MEINQIKEAVMKAKSGSKKRKFVQSVDLAISLRDVNVEDPTKRFRVEVLLPHGLNKEVKLCIIGDAAIIAQAQEAGIKYTLSEAQVEDLARNPNDAKVYIDQIDYFLSMPQMMANVGKNLGRYLGPSGKMPTILPPNAQIDQFQERYSRTCRIRLRQNPVIHCRIGSEDMTDDEIATNIRSILNEIENRLDQGANNINKTHVKLTMGPPIEIGV